MTQDDRTDPWRWALGIFAAANVVNAAWMLVDPADWYARLPAAVPDTGPLNVHFVRDLGGTFAVMGAGLAAAALRRPLRVPMLALVALFYVLHALVHVTDTVAGRLPPSHWTIDLPGVYVPAMVMVAITLAAYRAAVRRERAA
jgi:hypothetical protein